MANNPKYYIIESSALPEVFLKVAEAKRLLDTGEASTVNDATRQSGISRSAFYKYRDSILPFQNLMAGRIITFQLTLHDETGNLSSPANHFAQWGANIFTHQPDHSHQWLCCVTISAETNHLQTSLEELRHLNAWMGWYGQRFWQVDCLWSAYLRFLAAPGSRPGAASICGVFCQIFPWRRSRQPAGA